MPGLMDAPEKLLEHQAKVTVNRSLERDQAER